MYVTKIFANEAIQYYTTLKVEHLLDWFSLFTGRH